MEETGGRPRAHDLASSEEVPEFDVEPIEEDASGSEDLAPSEEVPESNMEPIEEDEEADGEEGGV